MPTDIPNKVARLIGDYWAVFSLVDAIEHELERRIVARLALMKLDALANILPVYKNILKSTSPSSLSIQKLENLNKQLVQDHQTGIKAIRHSLAGHGLHLPSTDIGDYWLFMKRSAFQILSDDLKEIDATLVNLDPTNYSAANQVLAVPRNLVDDWRNPEILGDPTTIRSAFVYAGMWTPGIVSLVPGNTTPQDITLRVVGLMTYIRQMRTINAPIQFNFRPEIYRRLIYELILADFIALEELVYTGPPLNNYGPTTTSLLQEWGTLSGSHPGLNIIQNFRGNFSSDFLVWKQEVRNKMISHVDQNIPVSTMELDQWPIRLNDLESLIDEFYQCLHEASKHHVTTRFLFVPPTGVKDALALAHDDSLLTWDDT